MSATLAPLALTLALAGDPPASIFADDAANIERCEVVCRLEGGAMERGRCCQRLSERDGRRSTELILGAAALYARAITEAKSDAEAREAAGAYFVQVRLALYGIAGSRDFDELERRAHEALDLPLPASLDGDPGIALARANIVAQAGRALRSTLPPKRGARDLLTVERLLDRVAILRRIEAFDPGSRSGLEADRELHQAFLLALDLGRPHIVCPTLLATTRRRTELLELDARICRGEHQGRAELRVTLRRLSAHHSRDVEVLRRHLRLYEPLKIAAITTGVLGIAAGASALLLDQRYGALCGHLSAEGGCAIDESPQASAARQASVVFAIAAPALLVTSAALYVHHFRVERARWFGICSFGVGGGRQVAAIGGSCRF